MTHIDYDDAMSGLFDGTPLERPVTCDRCGCTRSECKCPRSVTGNVLLPSEQQARVRRERRAGSKMVTIISGLDHRATDLPAMLKLFKTKLGTGGTVREGQIELQGDHRDTLVDFLRAMGYPAKPSGG